MALGVAGLSFYLLLGVEVMALMRSVFLVVEPSEKIFLTIPQKEDRVLLYIGYHSIPKSTTTHMHINSMRWLMQMWTHP